LNCDPVTDMNPMDLNCKIWIRLKQILAGSVTSLSQTLWGSTSLPCSYPFFLTLYFLFSPHFRLSFFSLVSGPLKFRDAL